MFPPPHTHMQLRAHSLEEGVDIEEGVDRHAVLCVCVELVQNERDNGNNRSLLQNF